jgi:site-specific recombinase XerD
VKLLHGYLKKLRHEPCCNSDYLFPTVHGNDLKGRDMMRIITRIRYCISFHFTWHQLRHTFATELVRNNFDIYNISKILGHTRIDTTKIYLSIDVGKLKKQLDNIRLFA